MSLARAASAFIERRPNATTVAAAMARGAAGDACAQHAEDAPWDARRCATFMAWSTGVAFALDRYVYSHLFARWRPPVWKSTSVSGAPDNSALSHFSTMTWPRWLRRAVSNRHRHASMAWRSTR